MNAVTRISTKGQVVIPNEVRASKRWTPGTELEVVERADGILLRERKVIDPAEVDAAIERLRKKVNYTGPYIPESEWNADIADYFRKNWRD
jgi:AbrB family looped-hinge helix DNA binding protein